RHTRWPRDWSSDVCSSDLLTITSLKNLDRQNKQLGQRNLSQGMFLLDALGAMVVINMLDLVPEHRSELVFTIHQRQQALADINVPTRQGEGVNEVLLWDVMESVRQLAVGMRRHVRPHLRDLWP